MPGELVQVIQEKEKEHMRDVKFYSFPKPDLQDNLNENTVAKWPRLISTIF